jgi:Fe-S-cluster containining protein
MADAQDKTWYRDGLRFECTKCGNCCTGATGYVWVSVEEAQAIADELQLSLDDFGRKYLRQVSGRYSLIENPDSGACVFLSENRCTIHALRPSQCRSFPFWPANLHDQQAWDAASKECEGINPDAPVVPLEVIKRERDG